jgi:VanZ family protein
VDDINDLFSMNGRPSWASRNQLVTRIPFYDKILHAALYFGVTMLLCFSRSASDIESQGDFFGNSSDLFSYYGVLMMEHAIIFEVFQLWVPNRSFDIMDLFADAVGIIAASLISYIVWMPFFKSAQKDALKEKKKD